MEHRSAFILSAGLVLGLVGAGCMVADGLKQMRLSDRYVTVKGLVERDVKADLALWSLPLRAAGNELNETQASMEASQKTLYSMLKEYGFKEDEIQAGGLRIIDRRAQEYSTYENDKQFRYIMTSSVTLRSTEVDKMYTLTQKMQELIKSGVVLASESGCGSLPMFSFTKLNELKPDMLAEATKNARKAAEQFAADAGSQVGSIRQANQGVFSIAPRDDIGGNDGTCIPDDVNKKVRVVTTVDYYLK